MMKFNIDKDYTLKVMQEIIDIPSPVGDCDLVLEKIAEYAKELGFETTYDNKSTAYVTVEGIDNTKTVAIAGHADTIGMVIKGICDNGDIMVSNIGGNNYHSLEGETVYVRTRKGKTYTGLMTCKMHSVHVFEEARSLSRDENTMVIKLDEVINSKQDVIDLGISCGDHVAAEPHFNVTEKGFIKSRFIDDKGCIASIMAMLKALVDSGTKPQYKTVLIFPQYEEVGHGGAYVPAEISEYVAVDIGLIGPGLNGSEHKVSICAKDATGPYDKKLTTRLVNLAEENGIDFGVDVFYRYGTDGQAANKAGMNLAAAALGPGTHSTHGMERTHYDAVECTTKLLLAYATSK